jgi:uncharacterized membrane protein
MTDSVPPRRRGLLAGLRSSFLTGLVVVLPVGLTAYFAWTLVGWIDAWILPLIPSSYQPEALVERFIGPNANFPVRGLGVLIFLVFTVIIGWMAKGLFGRSVIRWGEDVVDRMPIIRSIYSAIKQVAETFFNKKEKSFDQACLLEFPRPGSWALGFISTQPKGELAQRLATLGPDFSAVFVGLTPFTSGMLLFVPTKDLVILDMKIEEAAKLIVSGGLVYPQPKEPS